MGGLPQLPKISPCMTMVNTPDPNGSFITSVFQGSAFREKIMYLFPKFSGLGGLTTRGEQTELRNYKNSSTKQCEGRLPTESPGMRKMVLERRGKQAGFKGLSTLRLSGRPCLYSPFIESSDQTAVKSLFFTLLYKKGENKTSTVGLQLRQTPLSHSLPPPMMQIQVAVVVETYKNTS